MNYERLNEKLSNLGNRVWYGHCFLPDYDLLQYYHRLFTSLPFFRFPKRNNISNRAWNGSLITRPQISYTDCSCPGFTGDFLSVIRKYSNCDIQKVLPWTKCDEWWNQATTKAECLISETLSADQLNCRNPDFWKNNQTLVDEWKSYFTNQSDFDLETISPVFNSSYKSENAQEYWL